jgi:hypothetical protein
MSELFSEMVSGKEWVAPKTMLVIKSTKRSYPSYYNAHKNKWGGLLDATVYEDNEVPQVPDSETVDLRDLFGWKK